MTICYWNIIIRSLNRGHSKHLLPEAEHMCSDTAEAETIFPIERRTSFEVTLKNPTS